MRHRYFLFILSLMVLACFTFSKAACAQFVPTVGQDGKDVIWVPTPEELIQEMLDVAKITPTDYLVDLGSGDGRIVIAAAKRGARALGIEYNADMVDLSTANAEKAGVSARAKFINGDIFEADFSEATVVTMYLLPRLNVRLRPKILDMKPGTRVVSHAFGMEDWKPDKEVVVGDRTAYFWIVPARVEGTWMLRLPSGDADLTLKQSFQNIEGVFKIDGKEQALKDAKLSADTINFSVDESGGKQRMFTGRITGDTMEGTIKIADHPGSGKWSAMKKNAGDVVKQ